uniref:BPTI/Kunitz inhibitor domain-containing protein n=1 Tax=Falco tinnunculus TaxID=100819 RepID=A0A8C4URB0_FALTI
GKTGRLCLTQMTSSMRACMERKRTMMRSWRWTAWSSPQWMVSLPVPTCLPLDEGDCQRYTLRWYYNQRVTDCRPFVYSGCRGNLNRFDSKEECELRCRQHAGAGCLHPWARQCLPARHPSPPPVP